MRSSLVLIGVVMSSMVMAAEAPIPFRMADPSLAVSRDSRSTTVCTIFQSQCVNHPEHAGVFADFDPNAQISSARCMARPREFALWCGNPAGVATTATFSYPNGRNVSNTYQATGASCFITQSVCTLYPDTVGNFMDAAPDVETNPSTCMQRAHDWSVVCGNTAGQPTTATFTYPGGSPVSNTYNPTGSTCIITQSMCKNNPGLAGIFSDNYDGSDTNQARCFQRAQEFATYCGNPCHSVTRATFTNALGQAADSYYMVP